MSTSSESGGPSNNRPISSISITSPPLVLGNSSTNNPLVFLATESFDSVESGGGCGFGGNDNSQLLSNNSPFYCERNLRLDFEFNTDPNNDKKNEGDQRSSGQSDGAYQPQETVCYSPMYLCPQESFKLTRSSPSSQAGSNVSIVGSLVTPKKINLTPGSTGSWKYRTRAYSKRRGQERLGDRERQPSICSDSETDSIGAAHGIDSLCLASGTNKKWSLPLPIVTRSSESDSASSSWSARSADEATEDERSPMPSPSASTHSDDLYLLSPQSTSNHQISSSINNDGDQQTGTKSLRTIEMETKKLALKAKENEEQTMKFSKPSSSSSSTKPTETIIIHGQSASSSSSNIIESSNQKTHGKKDKAKNRRKKKMSRAAESHNFQRMKTTNYGRCKICDAYVYFWGFECGQCQLICHKKCLKKMAIMCPQAPLPPRSSILNLDLESLPNGEMVPLLVVKCTAEIERRSIDRPGIYRMTGVASRVEKLLKSFESGPHLIDLSDVSANDLTSVLKVFLRELKEPLITNDIYKDIIDIGRIYRQDPGAAAAFQPNFSQKTPTTSAITTQQTKPDFPCENTDEGLREMVEKLRATVQRLKPHRLATLKHMMAHLNKVSQSQQLNSMSAAALGIIFAPTIFRPRDTINDLYTEVFEAAPQARVIELLIRFYREIFNDYSTETETTNYALGLQSLRSTPHGSISDPSGPSSRNLSFSSSSVVPVSPPLTPPSSGGGVDSPPASVLSPQNINASVDHHHHYQQYYHHFPSNHSHLSMRTGGSGGGEEAAGGGQSDQKFRLTTSAQQQTTINHQQSANKYQSSNQSADHHGSSYYSQSSTFTFD